MEWNETQCSFVVVYKNRNQDENEKRKKNLESKTRHFITFCFGFDLHFISHLFSILWLFTWDFIPFHFTVFHFIWFNENHARWDWETKGEEEEAIWIWVPGKIYFNPIPWESISMWWHNNKTQNKTKQT